MTQPKQLPLQMRGIDYPKRDRFFAWKFTRLLFKAVAANTVGHDGVCLLIVVASTEDSRRYSSPPTFWNGQLQQLVGLPSERTLRRVRDRCVKAGWLHYEPGGKGVAGVYWVIWPTCLTDIDDSPLGESFSWSPVSTQPPDNRRTTAGQPPRMCPTSLPDPNPKPTPTPDEAVAVEKRLLSLGVAKAIETVREALSNGLTLQQITAVIDYCCSRPAAWGPGALRTRLVSPSAVLLAPSAGWPPESPKATAEAQRQQSVRDSVELRKRSGESARERERLRQLELQFGEQLDNLPPAELDQLVKSQPPALQEFAKRYGVKAGLVRPQLLKAFAGIVAGDG